METYNRFTQVIPTHKEVADYFQSQGLSSEEGLYWFSWMDKKLWCDSTGKKIIEWSKIAYLRTQDIKSKKTEMNKIPSVGLVKSKPAKKTAEQIISDNLCKLYSSQTSKDSSVINKLIVELISNYRLKYELTDDMELVRSIESLFEECSDWEFESIKTYLK
jgi:hypothetical protein